jgi:predicted SnoaL-like aldol condensation-catalyzing enzyme
MGVTRQAGVVSLLSRNPNLHRTPAARTPAKAAHTLRLDTNMSTEINKQIVLEAFDALFNKRDYTAAARYWSPSYIQHSAHIAAGRDGLFNLIKSLPSTLRHEPGLIIAEGDYVILHGRFSGHGLARNWIAADIMRIEDGRLVEHWDIIQDEATQLDSKSGLPMFGLSFAPPTETK